jgi:hypothetical protein
MTKEQKKAWLASATNEELLKQLVTFELEEARECSYGERQKDIDLTKAEILKRMSK